MFDQSIKFGAGVTIALAIALLFALITANPSFTFLALLFPPIAAKLLWKANEPPILFLAMMLQWFQVSIKVFYADSLNTTFTEVHTYPEHINKAFLLGILALFVQSLGIFLITRTYKVNPIADEYNVIDKYDDKRILYIYIASIIFTPILVGVASSAGGLRQFVLKIIEFKWSLFFIFYIITFLKNTNKKNFYFILIIEILLGFTGYFSSFKNFFLFLGICYLTLNQKLKPIQFAGFGIATALLFNMLVIWQYVKSDYRGYLSGGEAAQIVTVSETDAFKKLYELVSDFDPGAYDVGLELLVNRTSYIDFFSASQSHVPSSLPHENGELWGKAVSNVFMPRFFFPEKSAINDSEKTQKYTGLLMSGEAQGTSISLGYVAESYVDFGAVFMFVPLFLLGLAIGFIYKYILMNSYNIIWGYSLCIPLFFQLFAFETALEKLIGGLIAYFLVYLICRTYFIKTIDLFITNKDSN